ncbi:major facilitator superfamily domain-containing protein [Mycena rebaudengoi]|nr:major facilitator superfamily domain-containing protein [Mycena rebaudengoi]
MATHASNEGETLSGSISEKDKIEDATPVGLEQNEDNFPHGLQLFLLMGALCLAVFLVALDNTIIATAIPKITDEFQSLDDVGWYGSSYVFATAATQLLFGKFYTYLPIKWVYIAAITLFEVGSALCGAAPNSEALIVGRAIAGLGNAGIFSGALIIIAHSVPLSKRPMFTGLTGGMYGIASVAGPLMGGAFTDKVTWRWCFYINLPIGAVTLIYMVFFFKMPKSADVKPQSMTLMERINLFDPWGTLVFIPAIVSLLLALQWGGTKYEWKNGRIIGLFVTFGVLISIFVGMQIWKQDAATVPPRILKRRSIWAGAWWTLCMGASFFIIVVYIPIWFQAIQSVSAVQSGLRSIPIIGSLVVASVLSGGLITIIGYYTPFLYVSSVLMAVGAGLIATLKVDSGPARWIGYQILYGLGLGFGMQQPMVAAQTVLELSDVPIGTSILMFTQTLGGALFISVAQNVFSNKLTSGLIGKVPGLNPTIVLNTGATSIQHAIDPQFVADVLVVYNEALISAFYVATAMAALSLIGSLVMEWKSIKGKDIQVGGGA